MREIVSCIATALRRLACISVLALLLPSHALADWQYTRWGDSPDVVVTGSNGAAVVNDDRGRDPLPMQALLTAPYSALGFEFDAFFIFDQSQRLTFVDLAPRSPGQCNEIRFSLLNSYGEPDQRGSFGLLKWWHRDSGNVVVYSEIGECQIRYMEFSEPGQQGGL